MKNKEGNYKPCLVTKGFPEEHKIDVDLSIITKTTSHTLLAKVALQKMHCKITDIKSAFLQSSQVEKPIYLIPPSNFQKENNT